MSDEVEISYSRGREFLILMVLAAVQLTSIVDFMVVMPLGPQLERELHLTTEQFGLIVSSYTYAAGVAGVLASVLMDRFARRTAFLTLFAGFLAGTIACGQAPTYGWLLAARVLTGAFGGILGGVTFAIVGDVFHEKRRGMATGALMSAFALASVVGVPVGLMLGQRYGWNTPFQALAALGVPIFIVAALVLPRLDGHLRGGRDRQHPWARLQATFTEPNHLRAFALTVSLMFGAFTVVPYLSPYLVANVGIPEEDLAVVYIAGGLVTLIGSPLAGILADRLGKLFVYRLLAPLFAVVIVVATNLPAVPLLLAALVMASLMLCNAGRMVPAIAMITSSVSPQRRGGFLGANSAIQHISAGLGASAGGAILNTSTDHRLENYPLVGLLGVLATLISLWLAGRLRVAADHPTETAEALAASAQGSVDAGEPITFAEM